MRHSLRNTLGVVCLIAVPLAVVRTASAQSVWQKMKDAAKKASQQNQQQSGQPQPGKKVPTPGQGQAAAASINDSGPFKPPPGTKIEETVLAPVEEGARFEVSPRGVHVATVATDGSRAVVYYDGVGGPKFDQIIPQDGNHTIVFSPDSSRYAYCARSGNQFVVVVDGKELFRGSETQSGLLNEASCRIGFSSNNKHIFFFSSAAIGSPTTVDITRFVFDGKSDPPNTRGWDTREIAFSPDGDHYAYVWNDPRKQRPWLLVIDGKPAPYQSGAPLWTNDSKHLYTQRHVPNSNLVELLFDGKPLARAFDFKIYKAPVGDMVVMAVTGGDNFHPVSFLVVNGKKVPGSETVERGTIHEVVFSPDGKHYTARCQDLNNNHYLITDGKRSQNYSSIDKLEFTPDSSTLVYMTYANGRSFIVVGEKEFGSTVGSVMPPVMAPVGNRVAAFMAVNGKMSFLVDDKVAPLNARSCSDLSFTPDGAHYVYFAADSGMGLHLAIDGEVQQDSTLSNDSVDMAHPQALKWVVSPDSKHFAHFAYGNSSSGPVRGIFLDGKFVPASPEGTNTKLVFSPDSNHLFWIHQYGDRPLRIFVDGKPLVDFYSAGNVLSNVPTWWDFSDDGKLNFLAQGDDSLKRITITLSPDTSLTTMLGGKTVASNH